MTTLVARGYKGLWLTMAFAAAVMLLPARADATLVLTLEWTSGGGGVLQCVDNDKTCDTSGVVGLINYDNTFWGDVTGNWTVNVQVGSSSQGTVAQLHLGSLVSASDTDTLTMTLSDFFTGPMGGGVLDIHAGGAGTTGLSGTYTGYGAKTNDELGLFLQTPNCEFALVNAGLGPCNVEVAHGALSGSGYTMLLVQTFSVTGGTEGNWSTNTNVTNTPGDQVPEPATLSLFGLGLFGVAEAVRRRRLHSRSTK